ncbi:MAG: DUF805 domain-containing protein [Sphingomonadaceae bacterium]
MEWMILPFRRFAEFGGRSRRQEFWMFTLLSVLAAIAATAIDMLLGFGLADNGPVSIVQSLAFLIPSISVSVRRLHDVERSGWWLLLALVPIIGWIVLIVWNCTEGTRGTNRFGTDPKNPGGDLQSVFS